MDDIFYWTWTKVLYMSQTDNQIPVESTHNCNFDPDGDSRGICNLAWLRALRAQQMRRNLLQQALMTDLHLKRKLVTRNITTKTGPGTLIIYASTGIVTTA